MAKWWKKDLKRMDPYDEAEMNLNRYLRKLECGTEEYREALNELQKLNDIRTNSRESRRSFDKAGRASFWCKVVGGIGTLTGIGALGYYEMKGNTFTGEKRKLADGLCNTIVNLFRNR